MCSAASSRGKAARDADADVADGPAALSPPSDVRVSAILVPPGQLGAYEKESHCDLSCKETAIKSLLLRGIRQPGPPCAPRSGDGRVQGRRDPPRLTAPRTGLQLTRGCESRADTRARVRATHTPTASSLHTPRPEWRCRCHPALARGWTILPTAAPQHIQTVPAARSGGQRGGLFAEWSCSLWALGTGRLFARGLDSCSC